MTKWPNDQWPYTSSSGARSWVGAASVAFGSA